MVEGNGVWRAAAKLRLLLLRRRLRATSPNGSFAAATRVDGAVLAAVEARVDGSLFTKETKSQLFCFTSTGSQLKYF